MAELLGGAPSLAPALPPDPEVRGLTRNAEVLTVDQRLVEAYEEAAVAAADRAGPALLTAGCGASPTDPCARQALQALAARAYRRPLEPADVVALSKVYDGARATVPAPAAFATAISAVLQSPFFLYVVERGTGTSSAPAPLTGHERATRLSLALWGTLPDAPLRQAADEGQLATVEGVRAQAQRLLADRRATDGLLAFFDEWLDLGATDALKKSASAFTPTLGAAFKEESRRFVTHALLGGGGGTISEFLAARYTFANRELAKLYGLTGDPGGTFTKVDLPEGRAGFLTQGSFLAVHAHEEETSPILRGLFVLERLFCTSIAPPDGLEVNAPKVRPGASTRERFEQHTAEPACAGCHALIDPIGFAFEEFDAAARHRRTDNGRPVDAVARVTGLGELDGTYVGAVPLAKALSTSDGVRACVARQLFRHVLARSETDADECTLRLLGDALARGGGSLRDAILTLVTSEPFLHRSADEEVRP